MYKSTFSVLNLNLMGVSRGFNVIINPCIKLIHLTVTAFAF